MEPLAHDDSFLNPPVSSKRIGKHTVSNFQKRRSKDLHPSPEEIKTSNPKCVATCLNNQITFEAIGETAKHKHDEKRYGTKPCGLYPHCANLHYGGEDIGLAKILSPKQHGNCGKKVWICWFHCEASINGIETQIQEKHVVKETPKHGKTKRTEVTAAQ